MKVDQEVLMNRPTGVSTQANTSRRAAVGAASLVIGVLLVGWAVVQMLFGGAFSYWQPVIAAVGLGLLLFGRVLRVPPPPHSVDRAAVARFLVQHRIALIGASNDRRKFGNTVYRELRDHGYDVVPVNPHAETVEGDPAFASVGLVPDELPAAMVMLTGPAAAAAVHECAARGVGQVWLFSGLGAPGALSDDAMLACIEHGIDVVAGACPLMFLEPVGAIHRTHLAVRRFNGAFSDAT